jgi:hypothetical protein
MTYNNGANSLTVTAVAPESSQVAVIDMYATYGINEYLFGKRFDSSVTTNGLTHFLHVLSVDGAVLSSVRGANDGEVAVTLADGRVVQLAFNLTGQGGTIQVRDGSGAVLVSEALPTTVVPPPVMEVPTVQLMVARAGTGAGNVVSDPVGINCGADCNESLPSGSSVTLTATSTAGSVFAGWTGVTCTGGNSGLTCAFTLSSDTTVTATFNPDVPATLARQDFNDDGKSDVLWHSAGTRQVYIQLMNGFAIQSQGFAYTAGSSQWSISATGDFDGDGRDDLVWRNSTTGQVWMTQMNGIGVKAEQSLYTEPNQSWQILRAADFNGDGRADLLWYNATTRQVYIQLMNGFTIQAQGFAYTASSSDWSIVAVGDFDGDAKADLIWRNATNGQVWMTQMNGTTLKTQGSVYTEPNQSWVILRAADFNGDGRADILWYNATTRQVYIQLMNGFTIQAQGFAYTASSSQWSIVAVGDYDGDAKADLLWRNATNGQVWMTQMNGTTLKTQGSVYTEPNQSWVILDR